MLHEARHARDKCGVVGVVTDGDAAPLIYEALRAIQHRGQESAGIATWNGSLESSKGMGLVESIFSSRDLESLAGQAGLGHVRYSTTGSSRLENAHPVCVTSLTGGIALGHNGDIVNAALIREQLQRKGWSFITSNDSEVAVRLFANQLSQTPEDPAAAMRATMDQLVGAYSMVLLVNGIVMVVRDPHGIKPLVLGRLPDGGHIAASETCALDVVGADFIRDIEPGEVLLMTPDGIESHTMPEEERPATAHCMFEYVYFSRADSVLDGKEVYAVRQRIGELLAKEAPVEADVVVPVPDSGRSHALGFARATGLPLAEGLMKNRYVHRTFIMPEQSDRAVGVRRKLAPVRSVIEGKRVVLVDDSIVRGTTMGHIVALLRDAGAAEVHVRIGNPPIKAPCYLGIDMSTRDQLIAAKLDEVDRIRDHVGADSLAYISIDSLVEAIGHGEGNLCLGCLTGRYPVPVPGETLRDGTEVPVGEGPKPLPFGQHP